MECRPPSRPPDSIKYSSQPTSSITCSSQDFVLQSSSPLNGPSCQEVAVNEVITAMASDSGAVMETASSALDPTVSPFRVRNVDLVHKGVMVPDLNSDWEAVQHVHAGGLGASTAVDLTAWRFSHQPVVTHQIV